MFFSSVWRFFLPKIKSTFVLNARKAAASALAWLSSSSLIFLDPVGTKRSISSAPAWLATSCFWLPQNPWSLHRPPRLSLDRNRWRDSSVCRGYPLVVLYFAAHFPLLVYYLGCLHLASFGPPRLFYFPGTRHIWRAFPYPPPWEAPDARLASGSTQDVCMYACMYVCGVGLCHRLFWDKSIFVLLQKLFDPYIFFCCNKILCVQQCRKIPRKFLLRNKFFQCNFQTATASPVF